MKAVQYWLVSSYSKVLRGWEVVEMSLVAFVKVSIAVLKFDGCMLVNTIVMLS